MTPTAPPRRTAWVHSVAVGLVLAAAGACGVSWSPRPLVAQTVRYSGSVSYSTGSYVFAERTHSFWLSNGLSVGASKMRASVTLPLILQNSGVVSVVGGQPVPTGGEGSGVVGRRSGDGMIGTRRRDTGGSGSGMLPSDSVVVFRDAYALEVGDPSLRMGYDAYSGFGFVRSVSLSLGAKAPLRGLDSGVGTGEWDVGAGASVAMGVGSTWFFLDGAHWWFGDLPELELQDGVLYSAGVSRLFGESGTSLLASISGSSRIVPTAAAPLSVSLGLSRFLERGRSLSLGLTAGLSEASSDLSAYFGWSLPVGGS